MIVGRANLFHMTMIAEIAKERAVINVFSKSISSCEVVEECEDDDEDVECPEEEDDDDDTCI